jgi:hypothetical protein
MLARVRSRGLFRVLAFGALVACPLGAVAYLNVSAHGEADFVRALWAKGRFTPTWRGFEMSSDAGTDLLGLILDRQTPVAPPARERHHDWQPRSGF